MPREVKNQTTDSRRKAPWSRSTGDIGAPPASFRAASFIVSTLLLIALAGAIFLAVRDNAWTAEPPIAAAPTSGIEPQPIEPHTATPVPPTGEPESPGELPASPTATNAAATAEATAASTPAQLTEPVRLGQERSVETGGFSFRPAAGYALEFAGASVTLAAAEGNPATGAVMALRADSRSALISDEAGGDQADGLQQAFDAFVKTYASERDLTAQEPVDVSVGGVAGRAIDLVDSGEGSGLAGRIAIAQPEEGRLFIMAGLAPAASWQAQGRADFDAMLDTVAFFPPSAMPELTAATPLSIPVAISPTTEATLQPAAEPEGEEAEPTPAPKSPIGPDSTWRILSNGNYVNDLALLRSTIWAASDGGAVAWNSSNDSHVKFTTLDGLSTNRTLVAANCPLPGLGILFGSELGLQVFDTESGSWKTLNSANSPMSFDDVAALHCSEDSQTLIVAYARHGLDFFDAAADTWTHVDENDGLQAGIIRDIAVSPAQTIWIASQLGLTRYSEGASTLYNVENSPMTSNVVTALAGADGVVWLATAGDLYRIDGESWETYSRATMPDETFPNGSITGLAVAENGSVWVGTDQAQICRLDPDAGRCAEFFSNEEGMALAPLTSLHLDADGNVYYTTAGAGIGLYDGEKWRTLAIEDEPVAGNRIRDLAAGLDETVWIATGSGVSQVQIASGAPIAMLTLANAPLLSSDVRVIQPDGEGGLWLGAGGASFYQDPNWANYTAENGLAGVEIQAITIDQENRTWLGSKTGLSIWTGSNDFFNLTTENGLPNDDIRALLSDGAVVWIGTGDGLLRFQDNQLQVYNTANINLPSNAITALALDTDGTLLIGTERGLSRFRDDRVNAIPDIPAVAIVDIAVAPRGAQAATAANTAWIATAEGELYHFDGASWMAVPNLAPLPSPAITALLIDDAGDLWIGSGQSGVAIVSPIDP